MNDNLLEDVEKYYSAFIELKDPEKFSLGFVEYVFFIIETNNLSRIARKILNDNSLYSINCLFQKIKKYEIDGFSPSKIHLQLTTEITFERHPFRIFHMLMVSRLKESGYLEKTKKDKIYLDISGQCIFVGENNIAYQIKKTESKIQRFQIILILLRENKKMSLSSIARELRLSKSNDGKHSQLRKTIVDINSRFKESTKRMEFLIIVEKNVKNLYSLNHTDFIFEKR